MAFNLFAAQSRSTMMQIVTLRTCTTTHSPINDQTLHAFLHLSSSLLTPAHLLPHRLLPTLTLIIISTMAFIPQSPRLSHTRSRRQSHRQLQITPCRMTHSPLQSVSISRRALLSAAASAALTHALPHDVLAAVNIDIERFGDKGTYIPSHTNIHPTHTCAHFLIIDRFIPEITTCRTEG